MTFPSWKAWLAVKSETRPIMVASNVKVLAAWVAGIACCVCAQVLERERERDVWSTLGLRDYISMDSNECVCVWGGGFHGEV